MNVYKYMIKILIYFKNVRPIKKEIINFNKWRVILETFLTSKFPKASFLKKF